MEAVAADQPKKRRMSIGGIICVLLAVCMAATAGVFFGGSPRRLEQSEPLLSQSVQAESEFAPGKKPEEALPQTESPAEEVGASDKASETAENVWPGKAIGRAMSFEYDLDGDGTTEDYLFGVAFHNTLVGQNVLEDNVGMNEWEQTRREPMPCVWRWLPDGELEVAQEFASLLEEPTVTLWKTAATGAAVPQPQSLDAIWGGGIAIDFTYDQLGTWLYEATATIDGKALRAVSVTNLMDFDDFLEKY